MRDQLIGYLAIASGRTPVATPVFHAASAGRHWMYSRRSTVKASTARTGDAASLLIPDGNRWRLLSGELTVLDPLRPDLSRRSAADGLLAPLATSAYMRKNGRALASLWIERPDLLIATATAMKVLFVVHPTSTTDLPAHIADAIYTGWPGDFPVVLPVRRNDDELVIPRGAETMVDRCDPECSVTSTVESAGAISAVGSITRGVWEKREGAITFTARTRTDWDGTRTQRQRVERRGAGEPRARELRRDRYRTGG